jgi:hypothetical protein
MLVAWHNIHRPIAYWSYRISAVGLLQAVSSRQRAWIKPGRNNERELLELLAPCLEGNASPSL